MRKLQWLGGCLIVGIVGALSCSSDDSTTTTTRGTGGAGGGETGGSTATGGHGGTGGTGGAGGATGGAGGATTGGNGGTGGATGGSGGATGGTAGKGGSAGSTGGSGGATGGTGGATGGSGGATGGTAGTAGTAGKGGSGGIVDSGTTSDVTPPPPGMCGDASTGTGAPFPPLTAYTANDGGFGPAVTTRNTGDGLGTDPDGGANKVAIFRPAAAKYGQGGVKHPIIVWGNGSTNTVDIWQSFLQRVATYGFVVVAPEQTQVTADHMNAAIDYVIRLASDPAGQDCGKIDTTKIGSTGYSRGGGAAMTVGSNARISSTFIFAAGGNAKNVKAPWGIVAGEMDETFAWANVKTTVTGSAQPAFGAALAGGTHNSTPGNAKSREAYIGWMRWRLMGDPAGHDLFVGTTCQLCSDTAFSEVVKTTTFDTL
ncbi:MAG: hypothetical protein ABW133_01770 [Polyangiaceae bacterium]